MDTGLESLDPKLNVGGGQLSWGHQALGGLFHPLLSGKKLSGFACHLKHFQETLKINTV